MRFYPKRIYCLLLLANFWFMPVLKAETVYSFAVVPQQSASELAETWSPVLSWLSEHAGVSLRFVTAPDIPSFERRLAGGEYDFAYMNPYHFTVFNAKPGYQALARAKDEQVSGIVVVGKDSAISHISQLAATEMAFPAKASFGASILVQAELWRQGLQVKPSYVKSHNSVYRDVALGLFPAGAGVPRTFNMLEPELQSQLRILWQTQPFTTHAIAVAPSLSSELSDKIRQAMLAMNQDPQGLSLLAKIGFKGFVPANNQDWDDVRRLTINPEHLISDSDSKF